MWSERSSKVERNRIEADFLLYRKMKIKFSDEGERRRDETGDLEILENSLQGLKRSIRKPIPDA